MSSDFSDFENKNKKGANSEQAFEQYLEGLPRFEARPQFKNELRTRLLKMAVTPANIAPPKRGIFHFGAPSWISVGLAGLAVILAFVLTLIFSASPAKSPTASAFDRVYDPESQTYVNPNEASQSLGFTVRAPEVPNDYKVEGAALAPSAFADTGLPGQSDPSPPTLQISLSAKNPAQNNQLDIYEMRLPFLLNRPGQTFSPTVQGAQHFSTLTVQGVPGYLIHGPNWRLVFQGRAFARNPLPVQRQGAGVIAPNRTPLAGSPRPRPLPFKFGRVPQSDPNNPRYYVDFLPGQKWGAGAKTIMWEKDGVLTMLVGDQNTNDNDLQHLAETFHEFKNPNQK